jgi:aminoglycoside N3'-acetyltransferase
MSDRGLAEQKDLVDALHRLGIIQGDLVLVCSTIEDYSWMDGGVDGAIDAFLEAVGTEGTLAMHTGQGVKGWPRRLFYARTSPSEMGEMSQRFWQRPGAARSGEPVMSVAAIGPLAKELTATHNGDERRYSPWGDRALGYDSPWQRLYERDAKFVLIGDDYGRATLFRLPQVMYLEARRGRFKPEMPLPAFDQQRMAQALEAEALIRHQAAGPTILNLVSTRALVDRSLALFQADPLAYFPEGFPDEWGFVEWYRNRPAMERRLRAGLGKANITPKGPAGFRGVHRDIWARAVVLMDGQTTLGLILADQVGFYYEHVEEVRRRVEERCGLPAGNLMIACTHTHSVPVIIFRDAVAKFPEYVETVIEGLTDSVCRALAALQPVRLGVGQVRAEGLTENRRIKMIDGQVFTSRYSVPSTWYLSPDIIQSFGPVDDMLSCLRIEDLEGKVVGAVGNFAGHPISALRSKHISGDSFGHAEDLLEHVHPGAVTLLTNGAEGNMNANGPLPMCGPRYDTQAERVGQMIGGYWLTALARADCIDGGSLAIARRVVNLPLRQSFIELLRGSATMTIPLRGEAPVVTQPETPMPIGSMFSDDPLITPAMRQQGLEQGYFQREVQVFRINDTVWVAMPGEVFMEVQLIIKEKSKFPHTIVVGVANDCPGYIPTREAFSELGFEVAECPGWSNYTEDALGILGMTALELIDELWEGFRGPDGSS